MSTELNSNTQKILQSPNIFYVCLLAPLILCFPSFFIGLVGDDYYHKAVLTNSLPYESHAVLDLFTFFSGASDKNQYLIDIAYRAVSETQPPEGYAINAVELVDKVTRGRVTVRTFDGDIEGDSTILEVRIREAFESSVADDAKVYIACHKNSSGEVVRTTLKVIDGGLNP